MISSTVPSSYQFFLRVVVVQPPAIIFHLSSETLPMVHFFFPDTTHGIVRALYCEEDMSQQTTAKLTFIPFLLPSLPLSAALAAANGEKRRRRRRKDPCHAHSPPPSSRSAATAALAAGQAKKKRYVLLLLVLLLFLLCTTYFGATCTHSARYHGWGNETSSRRRRRRKRRQRERDLSPDADEGSHIRGDKKRKKEREQCLPSGRGSDKVTYDRRTLFRPYPLQI